MPRLVIEAAAASTMPVVTEPSCMVSPATFHCQTS
jgi:hypothetical protein